MKGIRTIVLAALIGGATSIAQAQPGGGPGPRSGAGPMGADPAAGPPGMGMGPGGSRGTPRWGSDFTPGWSLMTEQERNEHQQRMRAMKTYEECRAYRDQHREQMAERARERGGKTLAQPRRDACSGLKK